MIFTRRQLLQGAAATTLIAAVPAVSLAGDHNGIYFNEDGSASAGDIYWDLGGPGVDVDNPAYYTLDPKAELPPPLYGSLQNGVFWNPDGSASTGGIYWHPNGRAIPTDDPAYSLDY